MPPVDVKAIQARVEALAVPVLEKAGLELVELLVKMRQGDVYLEFTADKPQGGINIEECAAANHALVEVIDADGFLSEGYYLELSSPGLDRPLVTIKDFRRNIGRAARFLLKEAVEGKKEWVATVTGVEGDAVNVTLAKNNIATRIPVAYIIKAVLVI